MAPRALGATLALVAAILFTVSLATSAWWDGHPQVAGKTIERKEIHIGLHGASGCNLGETVTCEPIDVGSTFVSIGYGELGATGLAGVLALVLALTAWRLGDRRKAIAKVALATALLAAAGAAVLVVLGPEIKASQPVHAPIGWGFLLFLGGLGTTAIASVLTLRLEREPLRLKVAPHPVGAPAFDVRDILREHHDGLRPSAPAPIAAPMPPSPGGALAGPAGPLAPGGGSPLFDGAPQLRPLYEHDGHGLPAQSAPVALPTRAPTPVSRAEFSEVGAKLRPFPRPDAVAAAPQPPRPESGPIDPPPPAPRRGNTMPPPKPGTIPPPMRGKPSTAAPQMPPRGPQTPPRGAPTIAHAVPPPPEITPPPTREDPRASTETDNRLDTAMRDTDFITAVEVDREAKAAAAARPPLDTSQMIAATESTDVATIEPPGRATSPTEDLEDHTFAAPPVDDHTDEVETAARERFATEDLETAARERISASEIGRGRLDSMATIEHNPGLDATIEQSPKPPAPAAAPERPSQVPMSTAPASLPPPRQDEVASGPTPACPQCEAPMAWVEEHLRFYCKSCRMYF